MPYTVQQWPPADAEPPKIHEEAPEPGEQIPVHYTECFGCGPEVAGGLRMRGEAGEQHVVRSQFEVTRDHQGAPGLAHGGLLACAFDEALGSVVGHMLRKPAVTGKLETDFKRPVPVGSTLHIVAKVDGSEGRKIYASAEGRLDSDDGPVAVRARGLFVVVGFEHFTTHGDVDALKKLAEQAKPHERARWEINP